MTAPLEGIRILDFTWVYAGPLMTSMLADLGAEVIKVESRTRLDGTRLGKPVIYGDVAAGDSGKLPEVQSLNHALNRNKRSLTVDFGQPKGVSLLLDLVERCDVVCDNFRAGVMDKRGLGYDRLTERNPAIVALSLSGTGQDGPWRDLATYAPTVASLVGLSTLLGYPGEAPIGRLQAPFGDTAAGLYGCLAIVNALAERSGTGKGCFIDMAQWESGLAGMDEALLTFQLTGNELLSIGNASTYLAPHNNYRCLGEDSWLSIAVADDVEWSALLSVFDALDPEHSLRSPAFAEHTGRLSEAAALDEAIEQVTKRFDRDDLAGRLRAAGVAAAPVCDVGDQFVNDHLRQRELYVEIDHPIVGSEMVYAAPWLFDGERLPVRRAAPILGEANRYVLQDILGLCAEQISDLETAGVLS